MSLAPKSSSVNNGSSSSSAAAAALLSRQWWRVCFVHGDQTKYYRQLYGHKRAAIRSTQIKNNATDNCSGGGSCSSTQSEIAAG